MTEDQKKKLGAYYTPKKVTDILSRWAIRRPDDKILEPSFGGCNFLVSSVTTLRSLGCEHPERFIFGYDIDPNAFKILTKRKLDNANFILGDFLKSEKDDKFFVQTIIGNPPFVSIHKMDMEYKLQLFKKYKKHPFKIAGRSSLWVYFIVHALQYLERGGRMAWVVPDSIAFSDYGKTFLNQLKQLFREIKIIRVEERFFNETGTKEKTSFLLCDGYLDATCEISFSSFATLTDALYAVRNYNEPKGFKKQIVPQKKMQLDERLLFEVRPLSNFFDIRIGIVVGAAKLLILKSDQINNSPFKDYIYPIISKGKQLHNIYIDKKMLEQEVKTSIYIVDGITMEEQNSKLFENLLLSIPTDILLNQTFQNRTKLFGYDDYKHPDAFLTYYSQGQPKIVLNKGKELNCTNSVHRLYLKKEYKKDLTLIRFFALQTYADFLYHETKAVSRQYGNHIFKFELSDSGNIPLIVPKTIDANFKKEILTLFKSVGTLISKNRNDDAKIKVREYMSKILRT